ncbi:MAG: hypothetical protein AAF848_11555 [Pseudomonadota bacterium]
MKTSWTTLPCAILSTALLLSGGPVSAGGNSPWSVALKHCIAAFEKLNPVDVSELSKVKAPDWAMVDQGDTFAVGPDVFMTVHGEINTELASCTVASKGAEMDDSFESWASEATDMGIYGPVDGEDLTHVETIDWREPRMNIEVVSKGDVTWIKTYEVDKEA